MKTVPTTAFNLSQVIFPFEKEGQQTRKEALMPPTQSKRIAMHAILNGLPFLRDSVVPVLPRAFMNAVARRQKGMFRMTQGSIEVSNVRLSRKEAAQYLGLSPATLAADVVTRRHKIPCQKLGRRVLYVRSQLDQWAATHAVNALSSSEELQPQAAGGAS